MPEDDLIPFDLPSHLGISEEQFTELQNSLESQIQGSHLFFKDADAEMNRLIDSVEKSRREKEALEEKRFQEMLHHIDNTSSRDTQNLILNSIGDTLSASSDSLSG